MAVDREPPATPAPDSPSSAIIAAGPRVTLEGTCAPLKSITAACPANTLPVPPGVISARVTPSTRVTGITAELPLNESMTLKAALTRLSVVLSSALPWPESGISTSPTCTAESIRPGVTDFPAASITCAPAGVVTFAPTAAMRPPRIRIVPRSIAGPDTGRIRALVMATTGPGATVAGAEGVSAGSDRLVLAAGGAGRTCPSWKSDRGGAGCDRSKTCAPSMNTRSACA